MARLTLADAIVSNRLADFAIQAEASGVGPAVRSQVDKMVGHNTAPLPEDQTSHFPADDCLRET